MTFEQPLTERMRTFLRVEFLYEQTLFHVDEPTEFSSRAAVAALLEVLTILGRGDVRSDVTKELERHAEMLGRYRSQPGVDPVRLTGLIENITRAASWRASSESRSTSRATRRFLVTMTTGLRFSASTSRQPRVMRSLRSSGW